MARQGHALTPERLADQLRHGQAMGSRGTADQLPFIGRGPKRKVSIAPLRRCNKHLGVSM